MLPFVHMEQALHWHRVQCAVLALIEHQAMHDSTLALSPGRVGVQAVVVVSVCMPFGVDPADALSAELVVIFFVPGPTPRAKTTRSGAKGGGIAIPRRVRIFPLSYYKVFV